MELSVMRDKRPKRDLWAPGYYSNKCFKCEKIFLGDKKSIMCAPCAYKKVKNENISM